MVRINMCDTYPYIMLLWLIVSAVADKATDYIREQDVFVNHGSRNFTKASDLQCCVACMLDDTCESASYNDANKICQVNDRNPYIDENATKTSSDGWTSFYKNPCRRDWTFYNGSCYHVVNTYKNWTSAESNCQVLGGHLVDIQNAEEDLYMRDFFFSTAPSSFLYWIGLNDVDEEGTFVWSSSAPNHYQGTLSGNDDDGVNYAFKFTFIETWFITSGTDKIPSICKADP